jgi:hypothetical protein
MPHRVQPIPADLDLAQIVYDVNAEGVRLPAGVAEKAVGSAGVTVSR